MGFIWTILIIVLVLWLFGKVARFALYSWAKKQQAQFNQYRQNQADYEQQNQKEGEVKIQSPTQSQTAKVNEKVGEYVDFEEEK